MWQGGLGQPWPVLLPCPLSSGQHMETGKSQTGDWGRMDFTRDDVAQHFQDLLPPQILATSAVNCRGMCISISGAGFSPSFCMGSLNWRTGLS